MKNINIGIANLMISNKLNESCFNDNLIGESKEIALDFFEIVKKSPILQLEFKVFSNIEGKHIENELFAKDYIDNNIKLFEIYTNKEIQTEHTKLYAFLFENNIPKINNSKDNLKKINLYNAIDTLINESLKHNDEVDVDKIHESFTLVFNHIKTPPKKFVDNIDISILNEEVIEIAVEKFNEKYDSLNENDLSLFQKLIRSNDEEKSTILEEYKNETLLILEGLDKNNVKDNVKKAIQKIKEMTYSREKIDDDIISLHELKKELL